MSDMVNEYMKLNETFLKFINDEVERRIKLVTRERDWIMRQNNELNKEISIFRAEIGSANKEIAILRAEIDSAKHQSRLMSAKEHEQLKEKIAVALEAMKNSVSRSDAYADSYCSQPIREALSKIKGST